MNELSLIELDSRTDSFVTISLLWNPETDEVFVEISTDSDEEIFAVPADEAQQAFQHPFVYAAAENFGHGVTV